MTDSQMPDIVGKVVSIQYGNDDFSYDYIEVVAFEMQGGRPFLVGKSIDIGANDGRESLQISIAWECVTAYYTFDSVEHCQDVVAKWAD
jgi:hypothetical protein